MPKSAVQPPEPGEVPSQPYLDKLLSHIRRGVPWSLAAKAEGLDPEEYDRWLEIGVLPGAPEPYKTHARRVYNVTIKLIGDLTMGMLAGARKKNPFACKALMDMRFPNGIMDLRGDGKDDPVSSKTVRRRALKDALRDPNAELKGIMQDAGVIALNEAQREVLKEAGLLAEPKPAELVVAAEYSPLKDL